MPLAVICHVVRRIGSLFYKSHAGNCLVVRWGVGGGSLSYKSGARVCQVFRRVWRLSFKCYTLIDRWVDSLCETPRAKLCLVVRQVGSFSYTPRSASYLTV